MLAEAAPIGFIPVRELAVAEEFYSGTLGLPVVERTPIAVVVQAAALTVRLVLTESTPQPFTTFGWKVSDIMAGVAGLRAAAITPTRYAGLAQDDFGIWTAPDGSRIVWFTDPFGNVLSLSEHVAAAPATR